MIDWQGVGRAYWESSIAVRRWVAKHTSGFFAHGEKMARWHFRSSTSCPCCGTATEDKAHITQCNDAAAQEVWNQSLKKLGQWLHDSNTTHEIVAAIQWGLSQWIEPQRQSEPPGGQFVLDQTAIGWDRFMDGWIAQSWRAHQEGVWQCVKS